MLALTPLPLLWPAYPTFASALSAFQLPLQCTNFFCRFIGLRGGRSQYCVSNHSRSQGQENKPYFAIFFDISFSRLSSLRCTNFVDNRLLVRCSQRRAKAMLQFPAQPQSWTTGTRFMNEFSHCDSKFVCCGISAMLLVTKYKINNTRCTF